VIFTFDNRTAQDLAQMMLQYKDSGILRISGRGEPPFPPLTSRALNPARGSRKHCVKLP